MALPALQQLMDETTIFPPAFRFTDAMELVETVHGMSELISSKEREIVIWRANLIRNTRLGLQKIEDAASGLPITIYGPQMVQFIDRALEAARSALPTFVSPFSERPEVASTLQSVASKSVDGARVMRRMITRIDAIQAKQRDTYLFMIGVLREYRRRYEPYVGNAANGKDEAAYLLDLRNRYRVVNAKLAQ